MTSAAVQASAPVMLCATENRAMAGPAPWSEEKANAIRDGGHPAGPGECNAVAAAPQAGRQRAGNAQDGTGRGQGDVERDVIARARDRAEVVGSRPGNQHDR